MRAIEDNYWDFASPDLHHDIFEVVVDGDMSGGPLIRQMHPNAAMKDKLDTHFSFHGVHAQNYHIFTPAEGKDWAMVWGSQPWIKDLPYANAASRYNFKHGESGNQSTEQHPVHRYTKGGEFVVTLAIEGPEGKSRRSKVWDVTLP